LSIPLRYLMESEIEGITTPPPLRYRMGSEIDTPYTPPAPPKPVRKPTPPAGPAVVDAENVSSTSPRAFNPYPTTLPPLSPQMLAALEARRAASLRQLQEAEATADSLRQRAELENIGRLLGIESETSRERRSGLADLAAQGVARSPMFANPFRRELARQQQQQIGESQQQLTRTLDQLQEVLRAARQRRETELAQFNFDEVQERSNVARLLGLE
jgi:hypothetical protein